METGPKTSTPEAVEGGEEDLTQTIYLTEIAFRRLKGDESKGRWYEETPYSSSPTKKFPFLTRVPVFSLKNNIFDPAFCNPDEVVERCRRVSDEEIEKANQQFESPNEEVLSFKKGQTVWIALHGAGVTSYSKGKIGFVRKGKFFIDNGPGNDPDGPYDVKTGKYLGDIVFGFSSNVLTKKPADFDES